jgi:hypothetical protein
MAGISYGTGDPSLPSMLSVASFGLEYQRCFMKKIAQVKAREGREFGVSPLERRFWATNVIGKQML